jgi:superfamily II DNA/RNA helicase
MPPTRDELAQRYIEQLPYPPYPVQEEALLAWFTSEQGVMVCAPTGTGKTLIAQAALFEALHNGTTAYYTTPLIALTDQKFAEMQDAAERWGFPRDSIGLVTGNRRVNPDAKVLVVVAEILLNRLLNPEAFDFADVSAVVMDEFHSFADAERGIVWELSLSMLPAHVRLLLLSATVGNAVDFTIWLNRSHNRRLELVQGTERKVPLSYVYVPDRLLGEHMVDMASGPPEVRKTPALVFCFNRDECWNVAEMLKGLTLLGDDQRSLLHAEIGKLDWKTGIGPKLKQILQRGIGVHHAGLLPKYRRVVEDLFERKLLPAVICTETLAAGINLPARSVVLTSLVKGPPGAMKLVEASTAHQIFGRAGRPQFDTAGYVYALAHEDDVKILRWRQKYDQIPEDTKDPGLLRAKKDLKRKKPERNSKLTYWVEAHFQQLQAAPPGKLYSKGPLPWRLLAYMLKLSPEVGRLRSIVRKRLMDAPRIAAGERALDNMLLTLAAGGYVTLEPAPPAKDAPSAGAPAPAAEPAKPEAGFGAGVFEERSVAAAPLLRIPGVSPPAPAKAKPGAAPADEMPAYQARMAHPTPELDKLLLFRSVHPLYGAFLIEHLGTANADERIQALESVLEIPRPLLRYVRVPWDLPPGPLATEKLDPELIAKGLMAAPRGDSGGDDEDDGFAEEEDEKFPPTLADKLRMLFDAKFPGVTDVQTKSVWCAGELLRFGGDFNKYVGTRELVKQEGIVFRHLLRLILLCGEFSRLAPPGIDPGAWRAEMRDLADRLTAGCRGVDPTSTDQVVEEFLAVGKTAASPDAPVPPEEIFGAGVPGFPT